MQYRLREIESAVERRFWNCMTAAVVSIFFFCLFRFRFRFLIYYLNF